MDDERDLELEDVFAAQIARGEFPSVEEARADFDVQMAVSVVQIETGQTEDIETVWARMRERLIDWPHAAE